MELKYKVADVKKMIDAYTTLTKLSRARDANGVAKLIAQVQEMLSNCPANIVEEFMKCINDLESKNIIATKDNYQGVLGYIMIRLNLK